MSARGEKNLSIRYICVLVGYWGVYAGLLGYASHYLTVIGFSNTAIGLILALGGGLSVPLQNAAAARADRPDGPGVKRIALVFGLAVLVLGGALAGLYRRSLTAEGILFCALTCLVQALMPMITALAMESLNQGKKLAYGPARSVGAFSYAAVSFLMGQCIREGDGRVNLVFVLVSAAVFCTALCFFPFEKGYKPAGSTKKGAGRGFFGKYPKFLWLLIGCVLVFICHNSVNNFLYQVVVSKGGEAREQGIAMAVAVLAEMPPMIFFAYFLKLGRCESWLKLSGIAFFAKTFLSLLVPSMGGLYGVQLLQFFAWGLNAMAFTYYVNALMAPEDTVKGQACLSTTVILGSVFCSLIGGALIDRYGVNAMLIFSSACGAAGAVMTLIFTEDTAAVTR